MSRLWVRLSSFIVMLAVVFGSAYQVFRSEQQRNIDRGGARTYEALAGTLAIGLADLHSAQKGYVASGQNPNDWFGQVETHLDTISLGFDNLSAMSQVAEAVESLGEAGETVARLRDVDETARLHAAAGRTLMASDLVFTDGQQLVETASGLLGRASALEADGWSERIGGHRAVQLTAVVAATASAIIAALVLIPLPPRQRDPSTSPAAAPTDVAPADPSEDLVADLALSPDEANLGPVEDDGTIIVPPDLDPTDLKRTAQVCTDLGRVTEVEELHEILERVRDLLNASGLIVWVRDSSGCALRPATGKGYDPQVLSDLGRVACDADNATATAYRTAQLQTIPGEGERPGAVAVPLLSSSAEPDACIGVLSAEVTPGCEASEELQATATILAAQLATIVSVDPVEAQLEAGTEMDEVSRAASGGAI
jgi:hypothetical protein